MKKTKVVSAADMAKIESLAIAKGYSQLKFMEQAGISVAACVEKYIEDLKLPCAMTILAGKGNNAGDAYAAGSELLQKGFQVESFHLYPVEECSPLCLHQLNRFTTLGGIVHFVSKEREILLEGKAVILDGLVGTGFKGAAEGILAEAIRIANASSIPIISVDIPSGVCGDSGVVSTVAIQAEITVYLELPKLGFFLEKGWDHTGSLVRGEFGLPREFIDEVEPKAFLVEKEAFNASLLPNIKRTRNKYDAGYVLVLAGSYSMTGAGIMTSFAALRSGSGIVRFFYPPEISDLLSSAPLEIIKEPFSTEKRFFEEMNRADALIVGPGMGRENQSFKRIHEILFDCSIPCVIDADALFFLAKKPSFPLPSKSLLTPHLGEMNRLLKAHDLQEKGLFLGAQAFAEKKQAVVLLKGAPNFLFRPGEVPLILPFGNPGMAKAGTGDVLSGVLGSLLAQGLSLVSAATLGCYLHAQAGDIAAEEKTVFCTTASDLLDRLPKAFSFLLAQRGTE